MKDADGYVYQYRPQHPRANNGFVPLHQLVMEEKVGRLLDTRCEHVHHIDENPSNNEPDNLQLVSPQEHRRIHAGWRLIEGEWHKPCKDCEQLLLCVGNFYRKGRTGCQPRCIPCDRARSAIYKQRPQYRAYAVAYQRQRRIKLKEAA